MPKMPSNPSYGGRGSRAQGRAGTGGRNTSRNPPPRGPGAHRGSGGCPLVVVFFSMLGTALKWLLVKRKI